MNARRIVVGVDGSDHSLRAVRWAAHDARLRGGTLDVVYGYQWVWLPEAEARSAVGRQHADGVIATAVAAATAEAPDVEVVGSVRCGRPSSVLLEAARDADLVVVGSRGADPVIVSGGLRNLPLGSVSQQVAAHAPGPVVVVRGADAPPGGCVVVGVDSGDMASTVLGMAFEAAAARDCPVVAVRAYAPVVDEPALAKAEWTAWLVDAIEGWRDKYPAVPVETRVVVGPPATVLIGPSADAQLVVVGARGHGGFDGLLLGSVAQQVLQHAGCPVLIARPTANR